jgi:hypothetical protein
MMRPDEQAGLHAARLGQNMIGRANGPAAAGRDDAGEADWALGRRAAPQAAECDGRPRQHEVFERRRPEPPAPRWATGAAGGRGNRPERPGRRGPRFRGPFQTLVALRHSTTPGAVVSGTSNISRHLGQRTRTLMTPPPESGCLASRNRTGRPMPGTWDSQSGRHDRGSLLTNPRTSKLFGKSPRAYTRRAG